MSNVIDGVSIDVPPLDSQIITLAHHHRKLLDEAISIRKFISVIIAWPSASVSTILPAI